MLFNSYQFVYFLPVVVILYYLIPHRFRWIMLLGASYYFYMCWKVEYLGLIIVSTAIDYFAGRMMARHTDRRKRKKYLILSLITNLGLLFSFKYYNFTIDNLNLLFQKFNLMHEISAFHILLPVGISFYTFQTLSYTIDVYYGKQEAERHAGYFALYVSFFPQLVAGPIERFNRLTPQLKEIHHFSIENFSKGFRLILYGLFIKMVIADNISGLVDEVYANPSAYHTYSIISALLLYSFQIYSDFYGYSLIAIGSARLLGVHLMDNFRTPYLAKNIREFWQRWHISLSTWFRDYLYLPLGGNRASRSRWLLNILVVFTVSGVWHGANWTFMIWGGLYGMIYIAEVYVNKWFNLEKEWKPYSAGHLFLALKTFVFVTLIWVFFRSQSLEAALQLFNSIAANMTVQDSFKIELPVLIMLGIFILSDIILYNKRFDTFCDRLVLPLRWSIYAGLIFSILLYSGIENFPFIYFQF